MELYLGNGESNYEVLYIDKFSDMVEAEVVRASIQRYFGLDANQSLRLFCGRPVVVKKNVSRDVAEHLSNTIRGIGGVCWVQEISLSGTHMERRQHPRRQSRDRRHSVRSSAIIPDRRANCGRRSTDMQRQ